jgi:rhamnogalacturonyl hydrolase YesR
MYSLAPWYIHYTQLLEPSNFTAVVADVVNQFDLLWSHDLQNDTGLLVYGYDASKKAVWANSVTGASPIVWVGRSGGM